MRYFYLAVYTSHATMVLYGMHEQLNNANNLQSEPDLSPSNQDEVHCLQNFVKKKKPALGFLYMNVSKMPTHCAKNVTILSKAEFPYFLHFDIGS